MLWHEKWITLVGKNDLSITITSRLDLRTSNVYKKSFVIFKIDSILINFRVIFEKKVQPFCKKRNQTTKSCWNIHACEVLRIKIIILEGMAKGRIVFIVIDGIFPLFHFLHFSFIFNWIKCMRESENKWQLREWNAINRFTMITFAFYWIKCALFLSRSLISTCN